MTPQCSFCQESVCPRQGVGTKKVAQIWRILPATPPLPSPAQPDTSQYDLKQSLLLLSSTWSCWDVLSPMS